MMQPGGFPPLQGRHGRGSRASVSAFHRQWGECGAGWEQRLVGWKDGAGLVGWCSARVEVSKSRNALRARILGQVVGVGVTLSPTASTRKERVNGSGKVFIWMTPEVISFWD